MVKKWTKKKREGLEEEIDKSITKFHKKYEPHLALLLNIMLQASEDGDYEYLSLSSPAFKYHCDLGCFDPEPTLEYFRNL